MQEPHSYGKGNRKLTNPVSSYSHGAELMDAVFMEL